MTYFKLVHVLLYSLLVELTLNFGIFFCHSPSIFSPDLVASRCVINVSKVVATFLLCISKSTSILCRMVPSLWGPESVPLLSWGKHLYPAGSDTMWQHRFFFHCFMLSTKRNSKSLERTDTLAAKTLQSYICDLQNKIPWKS